MDHPLLCVLDIRCNDEPLSRQDSAALLAALTKAIDAVSYHRDVGDGLESDVMGAVVRVLLAAPGSDALASDVRWRRQLARWSELRSWLAPPAAWLEGVVQDRARIYLVEAARAAGADQ